MTSQNTVTISAADAEFLKQQVRSGRYASESDVVGAGLRLLEQEAKLETLRSALIEGEQSGPSSDFDFDAFINGKRRDRAQLT